MDSDGRKNEMIHFDEVSKHSQTEDCWLIMYGKVYDVTSFMEDHPGGAEVLLSSTGKDATADFEDIGHSEAAKEQMEQYFIGNVDESTVPLKRVHVSSKPPQEDNSSGYFIKILQFLVPIFIMGLAFAIRHFTKKED